jgi:hypothetical protein
VFLSHAWADGDYPQKPVGTSVNKQHKGICRRLMRVGIAVLP